MTKKELIRQELESFKGKLPQIIKNLTLLYGLNEATIRTSFHRGQISPDLARALHKVTSVHTSFWTDPENYDQAGIGKDRS